MLTGLLPYPTSGTFLRQPRPANLEVPLPKEVLGLVLSGQKAASWSWLGTLKQQRISKVRLLAQEMTRPLTESKLEHIISRKILTGGCLLSGISTNSFKDGSYLVSLTLPKKRFMRTSHRRGNGGLSKGVGTRPRAPPPFPALL